MPLIFWISTGVLVVFLGVVIAALATGRPTSLAAGLLYITVATSVGWQAVTWLQAGHPEASEVRHAAVWVQALSSCGVALLSAIGVWVSRSQAKIVSHQPLPR